MSTSTSYLMQEASAETTEAAAEEDADVAVEEVTEEVTVSAQVAMI